MKNTFPDEVLPSALCAAAKELAGKLWLSIGSAVMLIVVAMGAAIGGRVKIRYCGRRRSLTVPLAVMATPAAATSQGVDRLAQVFEAEARRLLSLRPTADHLEKFDPCKVLAIQQAAADANKENLEALRIGCREKTASERPFLISWDQPGELRNSFDGHELFYAPTSRFLQRYLHAKGDGRAKLASAITSGFHGYVTVQGGEDMLVSTPIFLTTRAFAKDILAAWRDGECSWPMLWLNGAADVGDPASFSAAKALQGVIERLSSQLRMRVIEEPKTLSSDVVGHCAVDRIQSELAQLASEIRQPECYDFFGDLVPRLAAILHVGWCDPSAGTPISDETWHAASRVATWLLQEQHSFVSGGTEPAPLPASVAKRNYPKPSDQDERYLMQNLNRLQTATWRSLQQRLPKRRPGYWRPLLDSLVDNGHVIQEGKILMIGRLL